MSKVLVNCNLESGDWTIREENMQSFYTDVMFYFSGSGSMVTFDNLVFGVRLRKDTVQISNQTFGLNKRFVACENTLFNNFLEIQRFQLEGNTSYRLEFWCENAGIRRTYDYDFTTPPDVVEINT